MAQPKLAVSYEKLVLTEQKSLNDSEVLLRASELCNAVEANRYGSV